MQRNLSIDILKCALAIMIIAIHTLFLNDLSRQWAYLTTNGLFRIAVPIFFLINGYFFTGFLQAPGAWLKHGLILYSVWMLIYSYYWFLPTGIDFSSIVQTAKALVIGYEHLWYIASMLGAAVMLYYLRNLSSRQLLIVSLSLYVLGVVIQYLGNYHFFKDPLLDRLCNALWLYRSTFLFAFPFFCIGYLINKHQLNTKINSKVAIIGLGIGLLMVIAESYLNYHLTDNPEGFDLLFTLLLTCPLIFMFFLNLAIKGNSKNLAVYSTAIYLVHFLVIAQLKSFTQFHNSMLTLATIVVSIVMASMLVVINRWVKYLL